MVSIKKIQNIVELRYLLSKFKRKNHISGYQIFDLECRPEHTDCYVKIKNESDESMIVYKELKPSTSIIRSYSSESLDSFLEILSKRSEDQFLLFVEGTNKKELVKSMLEEKFGYNFFCKESVLRLTKNRIIDPGIVNFSKQMDKPKVERANERDLKDILSIYDEFNERAYVESQYLQQIREGLVYILRMSGQIAGTLTFHTLHPSISIMGGFRISKPFQKAGLGKLLLYSSSKKVLSYSEQIAIYPSSENISFISLGNLIGYESIGERMVFAIDTKLKPIGVQNKIN